MSDALLGALVGLAVGATLVIVVWHFVSLARAIVRLNNEYDEQPGPNERENHE